MSVRIRLFLGELDGLVCELQVAPRVIWVPSIAQQNEIEAGRDPATVGNGLPYVQFRSFFDVSGVEVHDYRYSESLLLSRRQE